MRTLWIEGSPKGELSTSSACAEAFIEDRQAMLAEATASAAPAGSDHAAAA